MQSLARRDCEIYAWRPVKSKRILRVQDDDLERYWRCHLPLRESKDCGFRLPGPPGKIESTDLARSSQPIRRSKNHRAPEFESLYIRWAQNVVGCQAKPQCFGDSRDAKNDSIWGARREMQRRRRHAPSCMGATRVLENSQEVRFFQGKA